VGGLSGGLAAGPDPELVPPWRSTDPPVDAARRHAGRGPCGGRLLL